MKINVTASHALGPLGKSVRPCEGLNCVPPGSPGGYERFDDRRYGTGTGHTVAPDVVQLILPWIVGVSTVFAVT